MGEGICESSPFKKGPASLAKSRPAFRKIAGGPLTAFLKLFGFQVGRFNTRAQAASQMVCCLVCTKSALMSSLQIFFVESQFHLRRSQGSTTRCSAQKV